ncbi:glycosyltransferase family 4 protein [Patescibacteria group bacterium]|nr:glycosyltransferase family 4 protein [Patescibacteria group bacterium]
MRVLITTGLYPPDIGGPATYSKFLAEGLPHHGYETEVLSFRSVRKLWPLVRHIAYFIKTIQRGGEADVLYAQDTVSVGIPTAFANVFLKKKFLVRVPGDQVWEQGVRRFGISGPLEDFPLFSWKWHPYLWVMRRLQQFVVSRADALIVPSKYMERVVARWPNLSRKVVHIYNGIEEFGDTGNKPVLRGLLKFQGKLILTIGRLVPWKGFSTLIRLMRTWKVEFPDVKLLIVGSGPMLAELEQEAQELGLSDDVIFTGELERDVLLRYIRVADVFILNSRYEGLSHQLLEVMSVGVPAIASRAGGNPEVIDHERNGFLVTPDDTSAIQRYASALLKDANLRGKVVAAAKRKVKQFSHERMVQETARLLKKICGS